MAPLYRAFEELSGGKWSETDTTLTGTFFGGGFIAAYFVRKRLCLLDHGELSIPVTTAASHIDAILNLWCQKVVTGDAAAKIAVGDYSQVPRKRRRLFENFANQRSLTVAKGGPPPRCVRHALNMVATGPPATRRAWKNEHRWDMAKIVKRYASIVGVDVETILRAVIEPAMRSRGDSDHAITEFRNQVRFAPVKGFRCGWRTKKKGIFCPITPALCLQERKLDAIDPSAMTPATVWAAGQNS